MRLEMVVPVLITCTQTVGLVQLWLWHQDELFLVLMKWQHQRLEALSLVLLTGESHEDLQVLSRPLVVEMSPVLCPSL